MTKQDLITIPLLRKILPLLAIALSFAQSYAQAPNISYTTPHTYLKGTAIADLTPTNTGGLVPTSYVGVMTIAGDGTAAVADGVGRLAKIAKPTCITADVNGNVYFGDLNADFKGIRKMTPDGVVSILAGGIGGAPTDGQGASAKFTSVRSLSADALGNIYAIDDKCLRKIKPDGTVSTIVASTELGLASPIISVARNDFQTVTVDSRGVVYLGFNSLIMRLDFNANKVESLSINVNNIGSIDGLTVGVNDTIYAFDSGPDLIYKIAPTGILANTYQLPARNGIEIVHGLSIDKLGNLYLAYQSDNTIGRFTPPNTYVKIAGTGAVGNADGLGNVATFNMPNDVVVDSRGNILVADWFNNLIRGIALGAYTIQPQLPAGLIFDRNTGTISGTPTVTSPLTEYTVTVNNASGSNSTKLEIEVKAPAVVTTQAVTAYTQTTATGNGDVIDLASSTATSYGICWNTTSAPTIDDSKVDLGSTSSTGAFTVSMTGLTAGTKYYVRAFVTNSMGTNYGNEEVFKTLDISLPKQPNISYETPKVYSVNSKIPDLLPTNTGGEVPASTPGVSTFAGSGVAGKTDGVGAGAQFNSPRFIASDGKGNLYVSEQNSIRKITSAGVVSTLAGGMTSGFANGSGSSAQFFLPTGIAFDASGNLFVADTYNYCVRKVTTNGVVTTFAGSNSTTGTANGNGAAASFGRINTLSFNESGDLYVGDPLYQNIRKITSSADVSTYYTTPSNTTKDGPLGTAAFSLIYGMKFDAAGNLLFCEAGSSNKIRRISPSGIFSTIAGSVTSGKVDGSGVNALFSTPLGITQDAAGNIYVADYSNNAIRKINTSGVVSTIAGSTKGFLDGDLVTAQFDAPISLEVTDAGDLLVVDANNNRIRKITQNGYTISPALPAGLTFDPKTGTISGTPTATSPATNYTVTATNLGGTSTTVVNIKVDATLAIAPTVTTQAVTAIAQTTATGNGNITALGTPNPTAYGVCWNTAGTPIITDSKTDKGATSTTGAFSADMTGLTANTTYKVRAFATNSAGTSYGDEVSFTTATSAPIALSYSPNPVVAIINTTNVNSTPTVTGSVDHYSISPTLPAGVVLNTITGAISGTPTVLSALTEYTVTATNSAGSTTAPFTLTVNDVPAGLTNIIYFTEKDGLQWVDGNQMRYLYFTIPECSKFDLSTLGINIDKTSASGRLKMGIYDAVTKKLIYETNEKSVTGGVDEYISFDVPLGTFIFKPGYYAVAVIANPVSGTINISSASSFVNKGVATNISIASYAKYTTINYPLFPDSLIYDNASYRSICAVIKGVDQSPTAPTVSTTAVSAITQTTASSGGSVTDDGGAAISSRGICWNTSGSPTITNSNVYNGSGTGNYSCALSSLSASTTYYVRAFATNCAGTSYGDELTFTTLGIVPPSELSLSQNSVVTVVNSNKISLLPTVTGDGIVFSISPALPNGVTLNPATGEVSGTPTVLMAKTTFTLKATNSSGSVSTTFTIEVAPAPPIANAAQSVCGNGIIADLIATAPAETTVRWYDAAANGNLLSSSTSLTTATTYYAESWSGAVASLSRTAVVLTVNAIPEKPIIAGQSSANNKVKLCPNDYIVCSNFDPTLSYQWTFNGRDIVGETGDKYKVPTSGAGNYGLYVKNSTTGCENISTTVAVDLYSVAIPVIYEKKKSDNISILIVDNTLNLYTSYLWTYADGTVLPASIVNNRQFLVLPPSDMNATYMVNITDNNACTASSLSKTVTLRSIEAKVYPTVVSDKFNVKLDGEKQDGPLSVKIFNQNGNQLRAYSFEHVQSEVAYEINPTGLMSGVYTVEVLLGNYKQTQKVIIK